MKQIAHAAYLAIGPLLYTLVQLSTPLIGTLSILEGIWIAVNFPGFVLANSNRVESKKDVEAVENPPPGYGVDEADEIVAKLNNMIDNLLTAMQGAFTLAGLLAAFTPQPILSEVITTSGLIIVAVFIVISLAMSYVAWKARKARHRLRELRNGNGTSSTSNAEANV